LNTDEDGTESCLLPEVTARMYDPASSRFLSELLFRQRSTVAKQLRRQSVVGRLEQRTDLLLQEPGAGVAAGRLRERAAFVVPDWPNSWLTNRSGHSEVGG